MRLHLIDGTYEIFRAHYSRRPGHQRPDGRPAKATVGLVSSLLALLNDADEEAVSHIAVAFDNPIESFRNELFDGYKTGDGVPADLREQLGPAEEAVRALGVAVWSMDRWEADDALATGAARFVDSVDQVRIMTPDKDLGQCLSGDRIVQVDRRRQRVIDEQTLRERWGIRPQSVPDFLALVGDSADGIPGIEGFGEKTAGKLLGRYRTFDQIPTAAADWEVSVRGAERLAETLADHLEDALLYRRLATLDLEVPLDETLDDLAFRGVPKDRFLDWCEQVGVRRLRDRPARWRSS